MKRRWILTGRTAAAILLLLCYLWAWNMERDRLIHSISYNTLTGHAIYPEDVVELLPEPVWDESHTVHLHAILYVEKQNTLHLAFDHLHIPYGEAKVRVSGVSAGEPFAYSNGSVPPPAFGIVNVTCFDWDSALTAGMERVEVYRCSPELETPWRRVYTFPLKEG